MPLLAGGAVANNHQARSQPTHCRVVPAASTLDPHLAARLAAHTPDPLQRLPLAWRTYPSELLDDVLTAIANVLDSVPDDGQPTQTPPAGDRALPAAAPRLIVMQGDPRTGKDVAAAHLRAAYTGVAGVRTNTAICAETSDYLRPYGHRVHENNKALAVYRHLLQAWGMARQHEDPDYWPAAAIPQIQRAWQQGARLVVITGLRWPHDAGRYREIGGQIWKIKRPDNPYVASHYSETGFAGVPDSFFDRVITNDVEGDLAPFLARVDAALNA